MLSEINKALATTPVDGMIYLAKKLTNKAGFFVSNKHLLYVVSNSDLETSQNISTEFLRLNTNVDIRAFADDQQFQSGKYNILEFVPSECGYSEADLESFLNLCAAHAEYMNSAEFVRFFYSLINIFQIPVEQAYKNLIGLFGELSVIKYVYEQTGRDISGEWHKTGSSGKYDFVLSGYNLEVKSTISRDRTVEIKHSQLFNSDTNYLAVVYLEKNNAGVTINQLIQSMLNAPNFCNNFSFAVNVEKEKKRISPIEANQELLCVQAIVFFNAKDINPFPVIPDEISALKYDLDLSEKRSIDMSTFL